MYIRVDSGPAVGPVPSRPYQFSSDEMGCSHLQFEVLRVLAGLLISYFSGGLRLFRVGGELNFLMDPADPKSKVVPDLYILENEPQGGPKLPSWKHWERGGKVPTVALEVVSDAYDKDYTPEEMPARYEQLGVKELVRYDPDFAGHPRTRYSRSLLTHFVRSAEGKLVEQPDSGEYVRLRTYPLWLLHRPPYYLRIATGESMDALTLWPTEGERSRAEAERTQAAMEQVQREAERAQAEEERAQEARLALAGAVLTMLDHRGVSVSEEERARILECQDVGQLVRWLKRATEVSASAALFA